MRESEKKELNNLLQRLIQIKTMNPPGNEDNLVNFIRAYLSKNSIFSTVVPLEEGRSSLVAKIPGKDKRNIALCGHLDTVRVKEEDWNVPPFVGVIKNGRMYGRGTSDMKGGIAAILYSVILLKREGITPKKTILLALTADEESKFRGAKALVDQGCFDETDFLIIPEPTDLQVFIGEKGELWISVKFYGKSAHGSTPELGINTVIPGSKFILELNNKYNKIFKQKPLWGKTSMNVGQFHGGVQVNIVPNYSEIQLDFRPISKEDDKKALKLVREIGTQVSKEYNVKFKKEFLNRFPVLFTAPDNPYVKDFIQVSGNKAGKIAKYCTDAGIIIPKKKNPFIIFGPGNISQAHQANEYIELATLYRSVGIFIDFLKL